MVYVNIIYNKIDRKIFVEIKLYDIDVLILLILGITGFLCSRL